MTSPVLSMFRTSGGYGLYSVFVLKSPDDHTILTIKVEDHPEKAAEGYVSTPPLERLTVAWESLPDVDQLYVPEWAYDDD